MICEPVKRYHSDPLIVSIDFAAFPANKEDALRRIPSDSAGIYAWFRSYNLPDSQGEAATWLMNCITSKKFADRSTRVEPNHRITMTSESSLSVARKHALMESFSDPQFVRDLRATLNFSILFQAPLYVGRAGNLRKRIRQHLRGDSPLLERLGAADIKISECTAIFVALGVPDPSPTPGASNSESAVEDTSESSDSEVLFEEVFSRLFLPLFTIKYG